MVGYVTDCGIVFGSNGRSLSEGGKNLIRLGVDQEYAYRVEQNTERRLGMPKVQFLAQLSP